MWASAPGLQEVGHVRFTLFGEDAMRAHVRILRELAADGDGD